MQQTPHKESKAGSDTNKNPFAQQVSSLPGVNRILAVSSGKGGVGKSTVAANLALALSKLGYKVGLLDADIYGPSVPRLFGTLSQKVSVDENQKLVPLERFGVKLMSIGYLIEEELAVVWRGPMLFKAMDQFLKDVLWGELDYLLIDLPPGTGDVHLSLAQKVKLFGAVAISTPQDIALTDVKRAIDMWARVNVPLLGVIENMAWFVPPGQTNKIDLFPRGTLDQYLEEKKIAKLGQIPFHPNVSFASESGIPVVESHAASEETKVLISIANKIADIDAGATASAPVATT